jgi:hypothetical protein
MTNKNKKQAGKTTNILELNKQGLCPHRVSVNSHCQECHRVYIEMTLEAMGDDRPDLEF